MDLKEELMAIEEELWTGGREDYRHRLDADCLVAFASTAGVSTREAVADAVGEGDRWRDLAVVPEGLIQPTEDVALLTYRAAAVRGKSERYRALVSSGYVRRNGAWKLMFHQQTPLPVDEQAPPV